MWVLFSLPGEKPALGNPRSAPGEALQFLFPLMMLLHAVLEKLIPSLPNAATDIKAEHAQVRKFYRTLKRSLGSTGGLIENRTYDLRLPPVASDDDSPSPSGSLRRSPRHPAAEAVTN